MKLLVVLLAACGDSNPPVPAPLPIALPPDSALGVLAIAPVPNRGLDTWIPAGDRPFVVDAATAGWLAVDGAGTQTKLTAGKRAEVPYGCEGNHIAVTMLEGDASKLRPGLLWLRPIDQSSAPKAMPITHTIAGVTAARRDFTIGPVVVELVRTETMRGVVNVVWSGRLVHQMTLERQVPPGTETARPIDFVEGGAGVPVPEAAWSFGDGTAMVIVFRVQSYDGIGFKAVVVNPDRARTIEPMSLALYRCAF